MFELLEDGKVKATVGPAVEAGRWIHGIPIGWYTDFEQQELCLYPLSPRNMIGYHTNDFQLAGHPGVEEAPRCWEFGIY